MATTRVEAETATRPRSDLHLESWGSGPPVVLVHGSLATGAEEWEAQRPLADEGFRLLVPDRRAYGRSPAAVGEDFLRDADDITVLMGDGAHLVGHSYGGLGAMFAAARHPEATRSLTLLEPAALTLGQDHPAGRALVHAVRSGWDDDVPDEEWVVTFLKAVGSDPDEFPPEFLAAAVPLVPVFRRGRPVWDSRPAAGRAGLGPVPQARRLRRPPRRVRGHLRRSRGSDRRVADGGRRGGTRDPVHRTADQREAARALAGRWLVAPGASSSAAWSRRGPHDDASLRQPQWDEGSLRSLGGDEVVAAVRPDRFPRLGGKARRLAQLDVTVLEGSRRTSTIESGEESAGSVTRSPLAPGGHMSKGGAPLPVNRRASWKRTSPVRPPGVLMVNGPAMTMSNSVSPLPRFPTTRPSHSLGSSSAPSGPRPNVAVVVSAVYPTSSTSTVARGSPSISSSAAPL